MKEKFDGSENDPQLEVYKEGEIVCLAGQRASGENGYIIREVKETTLLVSGNTEFHKGDDAGDGYVKTTQEIEKDKMRKI